MILWRSTDHGDEMEREYGEGKWLGIMVLQPVSKRAWHMNY